ncbi:hypothetical protein BT69DRAFT_782194 [Atractiella rhizophila]|nr:hypothetical protein BT69DRAFT_782194 [Atractiella rhizophila]
MNPNDGNPERQLFEPRSPSSSSFPSLSMSPLRTKVRNDCSINYTSPPSRSLCFDDPPFTALTSISPFASPPLSSSNGPPEDHLSAQMARPGMTRRVSERLSPSSSPRKRKKRWGRQWDSLSDADRSERIPGVLRGEEEDCLMALGEGLMGSGREGGSLGSGINSARTVPPSDGMATAASMPDRAHSRSPSLRATTGTTAQVNDGEGGVQECLKKIVGVGCYTLQRKTDEERDRDGRRQKRKRLARAGKDIPEELYYGTKVCPVSASISND